MNTEVLTLNKERNVTLTTYIQDCGEGFGCVAKRPAVLILPGGAYQMCSDREADPVAFAFAKAGYHVRSALLCYGRLYMAKSTQ